VDRDQSFLLPPDMREWLPEDHLAWLVIAVIAEIDTTAFHARPGRSWAGRSRYDPDMMLTLLVYAYANKVLSSRRIEALCAVDVAFRLICAGDAPDHVTLARFRRKNLAAFGDLFARVLVLCAQAGMARVGTVAIDGTKIAANASGDANRSEDWLRAQGRTSPRTWPRRQRPPTPARTTCSARTGAATRSPTIWRTPRPGLSGSRPCCGARKPTKPNATRQPPKRTRPRLSHASRLVTWNVT
jgi:transposase